MMWLRLAGKDCHKGLHKDKESLYMHLDPRVEFFPRWMETA